MLDNQSKNRARCVHTVDLRFFEDQANGEWGLTHKETMEGPNGTDGFNAFWGAQGLFHDIFEHSHEFTNKYFRNEFAMNVGGEMAAMGALWYYYSQLGLNIRLTNIYHPPGTQMRQATEDLVVEAISDGYTNFGHTLESNVPRQAPVNDSELEWQIEELYKKAMATQIETRDGEESAAMCREYKKSVTLAKVRDLHRYGYRMAERLVPDSWENRNVLEEFYNFFDKFCKQNKAEELKDFCTGLQFKLYRDKEGKISWKAWLILSRGARCERVRLNEHFYTEILYSLFD